MHPQILTLHNNLCAEGKDLRGCNTHARRRSTDELPVVPTELLITWAKAPALPETPKHAS